MWLPGNMHGVGFGTLDNGDSAAAKILFLLARFQVLGSNAIDVVRRRRGCLFGMLACVASVFHLPHQDVHKEKGGGIAALR